jgi:plasmid maintenance system antidote protein VapI
MKHQHHGEILEQAIRQSSVSISKIARKTGYTRQHIYNLFQQKSIDLNLILTIGEFIHHDFSDSIQALKKYKQLHYAEYAANAKEDSASHRADIFEQKYYALLEEHNQLLKKYNKLLSQK